MYTDETLIARVIISFGKGNLFLQSISVSIRLPHLHIIYSLAYFYIIYNIVRNCLSMSGQCTPQRLNHELLHG